MPEQPVPVEERHPDDDALVEVALGHADPARRDAVTAHLAVCAACRRHYDEVADAVELVLPAVPRVAPPPGFESAALETLARARTGGSAAGRSAAGPTRRTVLWAAAAAVLGVAAGAGATAYLGGREGTPTPWAAPLVTADGATVGFAAPSYDDRGDVLVVDVTGGQDGRTYTCRLRLSDGSTRDVGTWALAGDRPNSWVVRVRDGEVAAVELVAESGRTWATAEL
jgi:anti-sigma factor RsiW